MSIIIIIHLMQGRGHACRVESGLYDLVQGKGQACRVESGVYDLVQGKGQACRVEPGLYDLVQGQAQACRAESGLYDNDNIVLPLLSVILGFIRRNIGRCPESIKETLYTAMVRPHLEYASGAWNPHLKKDINKLENIQRKASRFVKKKKKKAAIVETLELSQAYSLT